ncbi:hypothetical protein [Kiloniella sp.]|uniref:hypothetical protein n=1 Tax=Kiloniella sp. TaxID=1938587 RepID=UPI003B01EBDE
MLKDAARESTKIQQAATSFTRRGLLKSALAFAGTATVLPTFSSTSFASSGELEVFAWQGFFSDEMISEFKKDTGITVNSTDFDTNAEALLYLKATKAQGFDLIFPSAASLSNLIR